MRQFFGLMLALASMAVAAPRAAPAPYHRCNLPNEPLVEQDYMVKLHDHHTLDAHFEHIGVNLSEKNLGFFEYHEILHLYGVRVDEATIHDLVRRDPGVEFVEHDSIPDDYTDRKVGTVEPAPPPTKRSSLTKRWKTEVDGWFWSIAQLYSWGVRDDIKNNQKAGWFESEMLLTAGMGVDVYVVDTGVRISHMRLQLGDGDDYDPPQGHARNFWRTYGPSNNYDDEDEDAHGTAVAGAVIHTAPWANIVNVKVYQASLYSRSVAVGDIVAEHIKRKKEMKGAGFRGSVINYSAGGDPAYYSPVFASALQKAEDAGISLVTSAGNSDSNKGTRPCGYTKYMVCVGASTQDYKKATFSNYDGNVTVYAPGEKIWTAGRAADNQMIYISGTSFSSPQVAGLMALFISFEANYDDAGKTFDRLSKNWQNDILTKSGDHDPTPNIFAHSGLKHPKKDSRYPYNGPGHDELVNTFEEVLHDQKVSTAMKGDAAHPPEIDLGLVKEPEEDNDDKEPTPTVNPDSCPPPTPCVSPATKWCRIPPPSFPGKESCVCCA